MSYHREAPAISKDPVADSTDVYAFVSPDAQSTVTIIANYVPLQQPAGGPNFYEFGHDVLYQILIDNDGDGDADITYQFQFYTVTRVDRWGSEVVAEWLACPPCNVGTNSIPDYAALTKQATHTVGSHK